MGSDRGQRGPRTRGKGKDKEREDAIERRTRRKTEKRENGDEHAPTPSTKFDEDYIPAPFAAFPRVTDTSHRRSYVFLALSRPFHSILQHIHIILPFSKYSTRSRLQRLHRFAEARTFVTLLYLDARIHPRIASAAFAVFVLHFISHLHPVTGSPFVFILHTNYYTQSSYKNTVELLHKRNKKIML